LPSMNCSVERQETSAASLCVHLQSTILIVNANRNGSADELVRKWGRSVTGISGYGNWNRLVTDLGEIRTRNYYSPTPLVQTEKDGF